MENMLVFDNVNAGYGKIRILNGLSFEVKKGEVFGIIGPNGSGKTTMFNALLGLIKPTGGKIVFDGEDVTKQSANKRCLKGLGRTFQIPKPFENMSVYENVLVAEVHGARRPEHIGRSDALKILKMTGLFDKREVRSGELTLLDRKRLEVARAIGTAPKLLLLDEVAAGLTDAEVKDIMKLVASLKEAGYTIIWIEHIIETMVNATDRLMCMSEGKNVICGDPKEVMNSKIVEELYLGAESDE